MPHPVAFMKAFKLEKGTTVNGWEIVKATVKELLVEQYHLYHFPITVTVVGENKMTKNKLVEMMEDFTGDSRIVMSPYGNPYQCVIEDWHVSQMVDTAGKTTVSFVALGVAERTKRMKKPK